MQKLRRNTFQVFRHPLPHQQHYGGWIWHYVLFLNLLQQIAVLLHRPCDGILPIQRWHSRLDLGYHVRHVATQGRKVSHKMSLHFLLFTLLEYGRVNLRILDERYFVT